MTVVFSEEQIQARVKEMAQEISRAYAGEVLHAVGILENGFMFQADLVRQLSIPVVCQFLKMETQDSADGAHPWRKIEYGHLGDVAGKNLLLVDAMVDSGITLDHLVQQLLLRKPKSLRIAALVNREDRRRVSLQVDYPGFTWDGGHLAGYGLDQNGLYRNLPYVAAIAPQAAGMAQGERGKSIEEGAGRK